MPLLYAYSVKFNLSCTVHTVPYSYLSNFSYSNDFENEKVHRVSDNRRSTIVSNKSQS